MQVPIFASIMELYQILPVDRSLNNAYTVGKLGRVTVEFPRADLGQLERTLIHG